MGDVSEVWKHDHVEDLYAYYGPEYEGDGAIARVSEFGVTVHYNERFDTLRSAEEELRDVLADNPYLPGMEVWSKSDYGIHKSIVQKVEKSDVDGNYIVETKLLEANPAAGWEVGKVGWIDMSNIDKAEEMTGAKRTQIRENARQNDWLR